MIEDYGIELSRKDVEGKSLSFCKGLCAANLQFPKQPRDYDWFKVNIIDLLIKSGELGDGISSKFDDRKLRYNPAKVRNNIITIPLGISHFYAGKADISRKREYNELLQKMGEEYFDDKWAFFARPLGITILPITKDGSVFIGERISTEHGGELCAVAGYINFRNPEIINPQEDNKRELREEFGIKENLLLEIPRIVGISYHPNTGETDISFIVKTNVENAYFLSGEWMKHVGEREHKPLIHLSTLFEIQELLEKGKAPKSDKKFQIMYSTRHALESICAEDIYN